MQAKHILVVDDQADLRLALKVRLESEGFIVHAVGGGEEALVEEARQDFDLVLLDVTMPVMDGFETCRRLQAQSRVAYLPVIFLTGLTDPQDKARAFSIGAVDYIIKPFDHADLLSKVRSQLRTAETWQQVPQQATDDGGAGGRGEATFARFREYVRAQVQVSPAVAADVARIPQARLYELAPLMGLSHEALARLVADYMGVAYLDEIRPEDIRLGDPPTAFCRSNQVVVLGDQARGHVLVMCNPFDRELQDVMRLALGPEGDSDLAVTAPERLEALLDPKPQVTLADLEQQVREIHRGADIVRLEDESSEESGPVVKLVNRLLLEAHDLGASDIHIEPWRDEVVIRYRVDGELRVMQVIQPGSLIAPLVARVKIMSGLDIAERRLPQDGRFSFHRIDGRAPDFSLRVATTPSLHGEKVVLRILDEGQELLNLEQLGFSAADLTVYREAIRSPFGMILHVGPTGSGKSMSLCAAVQEINRTGINIQAVEDPIEYTLPGVTQVQIKPRIGLGFARVLRGFVRQDPDVILVGEIRDRETADIAVEAALTGHLIFSTLHTNDAASAATRLAEMGVEPFMLGSSLVLICAQRLIRRLCTNCREPYTPDARQRALIGVPDGVALGLFRAGSCEACAGTGYRGRTGIYELLMINEKIRTAISRGTMSAEDIKRVAVREGGMTTLFWNAIGLVQLGTTSLEEALLRVRPDEFDSRPSWVASPQQDAPAA